MDPNWLDWAKRLQAVAQNGLTFTENHFDIERYAQIRQIAAEMLADKTGVKTQDVLDLFVREKDYATPKVDVRGAAFREGRILLVKECSDGKWALPGGWADVGESPSESVEREVWEESGFTAAQAADALPRVQAFLHLRDCWGRTDYKQRDGGSRVFR